MLHEFVQKINNCFSNQIPNHRIPNNSIEEVIDKLIEYIVDNKEIAKFDTENETYESIEEVKFPQKYEDCGKIILDDLSEKEIDDPRTQATFKRSGNSDLSICIISLVSNELPKRTLRVNGNIYHIFNLNNFRDVRNLYQDKTSMDMTPNEYKFLTSTSWDKSINQLLLTWLSMYILVDID